MTDGLVNFEVEFASRVRRPIDASNKNRIMIIPDVAPYLFAPEDRIISFKTLNVAAYIYRYTTTANDLPVSAEELVVV